MNGELAERFERYRAPVMEEMAAIVGNSPSPLYAWMRYHLGWEDQYGDAVEPALHGKLLRPAGLLLAAELCGGTAASIEHALPAAAAVELVHNFSLLHDDIEDGSDRRRDRPTLWTFAGTAQAINTGDGMFTLARLAMHRLVEAGVEEHDALAAMRELDAACLRLVEGQYLDMSFEQRDLVSRDEYLAMAAGKTAAMFAASFAIGARLGGAPASVVDAFRTFGQHVGLAFQAVDDILGIWGDPSVTGKPVGDDLRARKLTLPVIAAIEAGGEHGEAVARAYARDAASAADSVIDRATDIESLTVAIEQAGGRSSTGELAAAETAAALGALEVIELPPADRRLLDAYAQLAIARVS